MPNPENLKGKGFKEHPEHINKKGRPPSLKEVVDTILAEKTGGKSNLYKILRALVIRARAGDVRAAQELFDRAFGKSQQFIDFTTKGGALNRIEISVDEKKTKDSFEKLVNEAETHKSICTN